MNILVTIDAGIGSGIGPNVRVSSNIGTLEYIVTVAELLVGVELTFENSASLIVLESLGVCSSIAYLSIDYCTTTTTTTWLCNVQYTIDDLSAITTTTTTTSQINCFGSYLYHVGYYDCETCSYIDSGYICNEFALTVQKWYYDDISGNTIHIVNFEECGCGIATHHILDESQQDDCYLIPCSTTTTTTEHCGNGYRYNVSYYSCEDCSNIGSGDICNEFVLTKGKWYYDPASLSIIHINKFVECLCEYSPYSILDETKKNSCEEVECVPPTTTTTTTLFVCELSPTIDEIEWFTTTTTSTTVEPVTTTTTTTIL